MDDQSEQLGRCSKHVATDGMGMHFHQCFSKAVVTRDGKPYCRLHDPVEVEKRNQAKHAEFDAAWTRKSTRWALEDEEKRLTERLFKCLRSAPRLEKEPVTAFGRQYVEWHTKIEKLLGKIEANRQKKEALKK